MEPIEQININSTTEEPIKLVVGEATDFIHRVYAWMGIGLFTTAVVAGVVANTSSLLNLFLDNTLVFFGLMILEILLVVYLSARVMKMSTTQASIVYFAYSVLNGVTLSLIFLVYTSASIASVFLVSALMFGIVSIYGFVTKKDLTTMGHYALMGLIGVVLASILNFFIRNDGFNLFLSYIAVVVFVALTAYDTQKIKNFNSQVAIGSDMEKKASIIGALTLYLDFINLFLNLLRIMGKRK